MPNYFLLVIETPEEPLEMEETKFKQHVNKAIQADWGKFYSVAKDYFDFFNDLSNSSSFSRESYTNSSVIVLVKQSDEGKIQQCAVPGRLLYWEPGPLVPGQSRSRFYSTDELGNLNRAPQGRFFQAIDLPSANVGGLNAPERDEHFGFEL